MKNIDWFNFEDKTLDFPIYKKNPPISKIAWVVLFVLIFVGLIISGSSRIYITFLSCMIILIPLLYYLKWDYKALFQKPKLRDVALAIGLFIGYIIYSLLMSSALEIFGIVSSGTVSEFSLMSIPPLVFSLMTEELVKLIPFLFFMRVIYKYSDNRKLSIILSMLIVMAFFASLHAFNLKMLIFALFVQGLGSIFEFYGYIKTKNLFVPYITHLCTDVFIFIIAIFGI